MMSVTGALPVVILREWNKLEPSASKIWSEILPSDGVFSVITIEEFSVLSVKCTQGPTDDSRHTFSK